MEALFLLIPISLLLLGLSVWLFVRMSQSGQFEDTEGPAWRVLMDDDGVKGAEKKAPQPQSPAATGDAIDRGQ